MSQALRTLLAIFDVDTGAAEAGLKNLDKQISGTKEALLGVAQAALAAFSAHEVVAFVTDMIELGSQLNDTSEKLGVSTDELQKFQYAAKLSGIGADEASNALRFLNKNIGEAITGNADASQTFAKLGVDLKDSGGNVRELGDVIPEVADAFAKMGSDQERTAQAMKIFGRSGAQLIPLLKGGSAELLKMNEQFVKLGLGIDKEFIKKADAAGDAIDTLKFGVRALKTRIAGELLPYVKQLAEKFSGWVAKAQEVARDTNIVKEGWAAMGIAGGVAAVKVATGWAKTFGILKKGGGIFENLLSLGKFGAIGLGLAGIAGGVEDIVVMCQGGESVLGDFLDEFGEVGAKEELVDALTTAWEQMQPSLEDLLPLIPQIGVAFAQALPYAIGLVADLVKFTFAAALAIVALIKAAAGLGSLKSQDAIGKDLNATAEQLFGKGGILEHSTTLAMANAPAKISADDPNVRQATGMSRGEGSTSVVVNVTGGMTNDETGAAVADGVKNGINGASNRAAATNLATVAPTSFTGKLGSLLGGG